MALLLQVKEDFTQLLNSLPDIYKWTKWDDVKQKVQEDPRYMMISEVIADHNAKCFEKNITSEQWFFDYTRDLHVSIIAIVDKHVVKHFVLLSFLKKQKQL